MNDMDGMVFTFEGDGIGQQTMREEMNECIDSLIGKTRAFAVYRFGLEGQEPHSRKEAAEHFSITVERAATLETTVFRQMGIHEKRFRSAKKRDTYLRNGNSAS